MAETLTDGDRQEAAENAIADKLFGPAETPQETPEYAPEPEPVVEGDEAEPEPVEETPVEETPELAEFELNGQVYEAPKEVAEAVMRNADYTQKTQDVAAQRREIEVQLGQVEQQRQQYDFAVTIQDDVLKAQQLEAQGVQLQEYLRDNVETLSSVQIEKVRIAQDDARRQRDELVQSLTDRQTEFQQAQEQSRQELLTKGTEVLRQRIPAWGQEQQEQVRQYAQTAGFTDAEISTVVDPRQVETLWKAAQYDALKAGATPAVQRVQNAPVIKPKSRNPMPRDVKDKLNLRKKLKSNKSPQDKADLIGQSIAERFNM